MEPAGFSLREPGRTSSTDVSPGVGPGLAAGQHGYREHARHVGDGPERIRNRIDGQEEAHRLEREPCRRQYRRYYHPAAPLGTAPTAKLVTTDASTIATAREGSMATSYRRPTK
jgi:hypothetical protein